MARRITTAFLGALAAATVAVAVGATPAAAATHQAAATPLGGCCKG